MKKVYTLLIILVAVFSFAFVPSNASAQVSQGFHYVNIVYAGPLFGSIVIVAEATDQTFTGQKWFELNTANDNALLATALTAMSAGGQTPARIWVMNDPHTLAGVAVQTCFSILFGT